MAYKTDMELVGLRDAIRSLNKIEPGLRKQFVEEARQIGQPAVIAVRRNYTEVPLSGMARNWSESYTTKKGVNKSRLLFPFTVAKAQRGVQVVVNTDRRNDATIVIAQKDQAAAIFETAGRRNPNPLERSLGELAPGRTRILGPAVYRARGLIEKEMRSAAMRVIKRVQKELD
jgi:hypothetical protein